MSTKLDATIAGTRDAREVYRALRLAAAGTDPSEHAALRGQLVSPAVLGLIDSPKDYQAPPHTLRVAGVLAELMDNRTPISDETLNTLAANEQFVTGYPRQELMIRAMVVVRPASTQALDLWRAHSRPKSVLRHVTIDAICDNGTAPAMPLFEEVMTNPVHDPDSRVLWMQDAVLRNRDKATILDSCARMLRVPPRDGEKPAEDGPALEEPLAPSLVSTLFEHKERWYLECDPPQPPMLISTPKESKLILRRIGEWALAALEKSLDASTKVAIEQTLPVLPKPPAPPTAPAASP